MTPLSGDHFQDKDNSACYLQDAEGNKNHARVPEDTVGFESQYCGDLQDLSITLDLC